MSNHIYKFKYNPSKNGHYFLFQFVSIDIAKPILFIEEHKLLYLQTE